MAKPIALAKDIAFAFPNVCLTTVPGPAQVPIPYPSIAQLADATPVSDTSKELLVKGTHVLVEDSEVQETSGDEPADPASGVISGTQGGDATFSGASQSVFYNGKGILRFADQSSQNGGNANGTILSAEPSVLVGD